MPINEILHFNDRIYLTDLGKSFTSFSNFFLDDCWMLIIKSIENTKIEWQFSCSYNDPNIDLDRSNVYILEQNIFNN